MFHYYTVNHEKVTIAFYPCFSDGKPFEIPHNNLDLEIFSNNYSDTGVLWVKYFEINDNNFLFFVSNDYISLHVSEGDLIEPMLNKLVESFQKEAIKDYETLVKLSKEI